MDTLPVEIIVEIASNLTFASFGRLILVNTRLRSILSTHWTVVLGKIIRKEFTPYDGFLRALQVDGKESLGKVVGGFQSVLNFCRVIKLWEGEFQRLKCESFGEEEFKRMREGVYLWRRYALDFHGRWDRDDSRFMRGLEREELCGLKEVWGVVREGVGREVCPSAEKVIEQSGNSLSIAEAERIGWGEGTENDHVLATIMRLMPEDILHLLIYRHRYASKTSVIQFARLRNPWIENSMETLSLALRGVRDGFEERLDNFSGCEHDEASLELAEVDGWNGGRVGGYHLKNLGFRYEHYDTGSVQKGRLVLRRY
ncbi:hypothetical protein QBC38DRAFT_156092 [Podospora fimiseda]|uniref:F-box domain-containing protein n=1 Tax=Podospora fimiseda TaxID=252190 RepID=A0AAN7BRZ2_9PEZI|nr:hypothetical protein QBC38DRAFT_156092 [Podospora fimiseda]